MFLNCAQLCLLKCSPRRGYLWWDIHSTSLHVPVPLLFCLPFPQWHKQFSCASDVDFFTQIFTRHKTTFAFCRCRASLATRLISHYTSLTLGSSQERTCFYRLQGFSLEPFVSANVSGSDYLPPTDIFDSNPLSINASSNEVSSYRSHFLSWKIIHTWGLCSPPALTGAFKYTPKRCMLGVTTRKKAAIWCGPPALPVKNVRSTVARCRKL